MRDEVTIEDIFQAILDLSTELKETKTELKQDISAVKAEMKDDIAKVDKKVDLVNRKFAVFSEEFIEVKADIRELQQVNQLL